MHRVQPDLPMDGVRMPGSFGFYIQGLDSLARSARERSLSLALPSTKSEVDGSRVGCRVGALQDMMCETLAPGGNPPPSWLAGSTPVMETWLTGARSWCDSCLLECHPLRPQIETQPLEWQPEQVQPSITGGIHFRQPEETCVTHLVNGPENHGFFGRFRNQLEI